MTAATQAELIEAMANSYALHVDHKIGKACPTCRRIAKAMAPAVVDFVEKWMRDQGYPWTADVWREDMAS